MNYNSLMNKPTINYKELIGDNTVTEVGGITEEQFNTLLSTDLSSYYTKAQIDDLFARSFVYREKSGSIVTFDCPSTSQSIPKVTVDIEAVQAGTGDPSPTNVRPISGWSAVNVAKCSENLYAKTNNIIIAKSIPNGTKVYVQIFGGTFAGASLYGKSNTTDWVSLGTILQSKNVITINRDDIIELKISTSAYSDLIRGNSDLMVSFTDFDDFVAYNGHTYTTALKDENDQPLTCYGGELENVNGVQTLTVTHTNIASYNGEAINEPWISSMDVYSEGATPTTGAQVVYPLTTPTEIPQQSQAISTQDGTNNLWADSGDIEVKCLDRIIPAEE